MILILKNLITSISIDNLETGSSPDIAVVARLVVNDPYKGNVILVGSSIAYNNLIYDQRE